MNLAGEIRESVSLDEDELSDIEDEVFIRDGKRGFKFEDVSVKKPLMAPRRKISKPISTRIRNKQSCRTFCRLFCYSVLALGTLLGLIALVIVLVSIFPLPLDKLRDWIVLKSAPAQLKKKTVQCSEFEVKELWKVDFPKLSSETAVSMVDIDHDGVEDVIFGFSTGDGYQIPSETFCLIFMNISQPCGGGIIALNGTNGNLLWKHWISGPIFDLICTADFNEDKTPDCLISGKSGLLRIINSKNGYLIWTLENKKSPPSSKINVYQPTIISDLDNDNISDIIATHSIEKDTIMGYLVVISGKNGTVMQKIPITETGTPTYCKPQIIKTPDGNTSVLFGTGSLTTGGALYLSNLKNIMEGDMNSSQVLHRDEHKGILSPSVLVDITGDGVEDIVSATFNSIVIAIDGNSFKMLWNYTIPNSETLSVPTPGYFNNDNVTDFLIKYQTGIGFPVYYYSQTFVLDGKTGKPIIYSEPYVDSVGAQMGGLTIETEEHGFDWFLFWTGDCKDHKNSQDIFQFVNEPSNNEPVEETLLKQTQADLCFLRYNSTTVVSIYALSQFDQPPGFKIYNSEDDQPTNFSKFYDPIEEAREFFKKHQSKLIMNSTTIKNQIKPTKKYKNGSNFRHKNIDDIAKGDTKKHQRINNEYEQSDLDLDYNHPSEDDWLPFPQRMPESDLDYAGNSYLRDSENDENIQSSKEQLHKSRPNMNNFRDSRSRKTMETKNKNNVTKNHKKSEIAKHGKDLKKNLADKIYKIYDYKNVKNSQKRLLTDLNTLPNEILRQTYLKNARRSIKNSKFEVRDLNSHDKINNIELDLKNTSHLNLSYTLWDLESENEMKERNKVGEFWRRKREIERDTSKVPRTTTLGSLVRPLNKNNTGIDLILVTYWVPSVTDTEILLKDNLKCIADNLKITMNSKEQLQSLLYSSSIENSILRKCKKQTIKASSKIDNKTIAEFPFFKEISKLKFGELSVRRLSVQCKCKNLRKTEKCANFLQSKDQQWSSYLGKLSNGYFKTRN